VLGRRQPRSDTIVPCRSGGYTDGAARIHLNGSELTLRVEVELQTIDDEERLEAFSESVDRLLESLEPVSKRLGRHAEFPHSPADGQGAQLYQAAAGLCRNRRLSATGCRLSGRRAPAERTEVAFS
jgi:hypothetical protein